MYGTREVGPDVQVLPEKLSTAQGAPPGVKAISFALHSELSKPQAAMLLRQLVSTYENDTSGIAAEEAKAKLRPKEDEITMARNVVRWWLPVGQT